MRRERALAAPPEAVWEVVSAPERLPRWWPGVTRVEEATPSAWTKVLSSPRGKTVRADYSLVQSEHGRRLVWRQEVDESPFERLLAESHTEIELNPEAGGTRVAIVLRQRPRGWARFGFLQFRRAAAKQVEEALDGLAGLVGEER